MSPISVVWVVGVFWRCIEYQGKGRQKLLTGNGTLKIECLFQVQLSMRLLLQIAQIYFYKITMFV